MIWIRILTRVWGEPSCLALWMSNAAKPRTGIDQRLEDDVFRSVGGSRNRMEKDRF